MLVNFILIALTYLLTALYYERKILRMKLARAQEQIAEERRLEHERLITEATPKESLATETYKRYKKKAMTVQFKEVGDE